MISVLSDLTCKYVNSGTHLKHDNHKFGLFASEKHLGPVVQSIVSLTSSLRVISLTVLADSIYNFLKFFAEKM